MALCTLWIYWTRQNSHHIRDYSYPLFPINNTLLNIIVVETVEESSKTKQSLWSATQSGGMPFFNIQTAPVQQFSCFQWSATSLLWLGFIFYMNYIVYTILAWCAAMAEQLYSNPAQCETNILKTSCQTAILLKYKSTSFTRSPCICLLTIQIQRDGRCSNKCWSTAVRNLSPSQKFLKPLTLALSSALYSKNKIK